MALPTALFAMIASFGFASAAILSSVDAQRGTARDGDSKSAIAAADAGASVALLRLNRFQDNLTAATPCIGPGGEPTTPTAGWCPATPSEAVGNSAYSYQVSAYQPDSELSVVALGTADRVSRRVEIGLISLDGENVFANERLIGQDDISLDGTPEIETDIGTNGDIENSGDGTICGDIRHGLGQSAPEPDCDGEVDESNRDLPELVPPEGIATVNSNCRLSDTCADEEEVDTYSKSRTATTPWDPETRTLEIGQNSTLTMGGGDYFICRLSIGPGILYMAADADIRIFFDTPENCGMEAGDVRMSVEGNAEIVSTGFDPDMGQFDVPGFYFLGSPDIPTQINLEANSGTGNEVMLYAPHSDIDLGGKATWIGMIAGKTIHLHGTPTIRSDPRMTPPDITLSSLWERTHYVECTGATGSPPDASC